MYNESTYQEELSLWVFIYYNNLFDVIYYLKLKIFGLAYTQCQITAYFVQHYCFIVSNFFCNAL